MQSIVARAMGCELGRGVLGACAAALMLGCAGFDRELLEDWIDGNEPGDFGGGHGHGHGHGGDDPGSGCAFISSDDVWRTAAQDLQTLDGDDQPFTRYLTLANLANANGCGAALEKSRAALDKLVNSVSSAPRAIRLTAVDAALTLFRLDLRDYNWDRVIPVGDTMFVDGWEAILAASPYAVPFSGDDADDVALDTGTAVAVLFGDAFVAAVSNAPLYYGLLGIPENVDDFVLDELQVDVAANRADGNVIRAGLGGTGVGRLEFLVERHAIGVRTGALWQIFSDEGGARALTDDPLSTPASAERELAFHLPNGLLAHVLADADGTRIDDSELTLDTSEANFRATIARSYMKFRSRGVRPTDQVRDIVLADPGEFEPEELARILSVYPPAGALENTVRSDVAPLDAALEQLGVDPDAPDPVDAAFLEFDRDVDAEAAAAALYVSTDELIENLPRLDPALGVLERGTLDRQDFDGLYAQSLCLLAAGRDNPVDPDACD